jgi:hypothetical protein
MASLGKIRSVKNLTEASARQMGKLVIPTPIANNGGYHFSCDGGVPFTCSANHRVNREFVITKVTALLRLNDNVDSWPEVLRRWNARHPEQIRSQPNKPNGNAHREITGTATTSGRTPKAPKFTAGTQTRRVPAYILPPMQPAAVKEAKPEDAVVAVLGAYVRLDGDERVSLRKGLNIASTLGEELLAAVRLGAPMRQLARIGFARRQKTVVSNIAYAQDKLVRASEDAGLPLTVEQIAVMIWMLENDPRGPAVKAWLNGQGDELIGSSYRPAIPASEIRKMRRSLVTRIAEITHDPAQVTDLPQVYGLPMISRAAAVAMPMVGG